MRTDSINQPLFRISILIKILVIALASQSFKPVYAIQDTSGSINLRIAADRNLDDDIVRLAESKTDPNIYQDGRLVARWLSVRPDEEEEIKDKPDIVSRINDKGHLQALVLISPDDINTSDIEDIRLNKPSGLMLSLNKTGAQRFFTLTRLNIDRYSFFIVDDIIYLSPKITSPIFQYVAFSGNFTLADIEALKEMLDPSLSNNSHRAGLSVFWEAIIFNIIFLVYLIILIFYVKRKKLSSMAALASIGGMFLGAAIFGIAVNSNTRSFSIEMQFLALNFRISLMKSFIGAVIGAALGIIGTHWARKISYHNS